MILIFKHFIIVINNEREILRKKNIKDIFYFYFHTPRTSQNRLGLNGVNGI